MLYDINGVCVLHCMSESQQDLQIKGKYINKIFE